METKGLRDYFTSDAVAYLLRGNGKYNAAAIRVYLRQHREVFGLAAALAVEGGEVGEFIAV
jgi:hypothetical protein